MPTYEYQCRKCKKKFDKLQSMTESPLTRCVYCKGKVERLISAGAGLIFKGAGFYITDYKRQKSEDRGQKSEDRGHKIEDRKQRTEDKGQKTAGGGRQKSKEKKLEK